MPVELELGADGADIFEVRGYPRPRSRPAPAGRRRPIGGSPSATTASTSIQRLTHIAFSEPAASVEPVDDSSPEGSDTRAQRVRLRWTLTLGPGEDARAELDRLVHGSPGPAGCRRRADRPRPTRRPCSRRSRACPRDEGAAAYHAWERGTTSVVSDHELFNLVIKRSVSRPAPARQRRPGRRTSATSRPACRGSPRCSGAIR